MDSRLKRSSRLLCNGLFLLSVITLLTECRRKNPEPNELKKFQGLWSLLSFEMLDSNDHWVKYPWNEDGTGFLMYDGIGHGAIHISPKGYSEIVWPDVDSMTTEQLKEAFETHQNNYFYMARCEVDTINHQIIHTRISHSRPEDWGKTVRRKYEFIGKDTLVLRPVEGEVERKLVWVRN